MPGAGIGGGRDSSGCDISITGGVVQAQGYFGAGIGGGMNGDSWNILIKDTTLTALAFPLYPSSDYTELSASAVGRGSNRTHYMSAMKNQEDLLYEENIKIGASDGKSVRLARQVGSGTAARDRMRWTGAPRRSFSYPTKMGAWTCSG